MCAGEEAVCVRSLIQTPASWCPGVKSERNSPVLRRPGCWCVLALGRRHCPFYPALTCLPVCLTVAKLNTVQFNVRIKEQLSCLLCLQPQAHLSLGCSHGASPDTGAAGRTSQPASAEGKSKVIQLGNLFPWRLFPRRLVAATASP